MLHILLMILKITLWIILGILGLLFVLMLLVLFAPITYKVDAKYDKTAQIHAKIKFLILSVRVLFDQEKNIFNQDIRILGIKLKLGSDKKKRKKKKQKNNVVQEIGNEAYETVVDDETIEENEIIEENESVEKYKEKEDINEQYESADDFSENNESLVDEFNMIDEKFDVLNDKNNDLPKEEKKVLGRIKAFFKGIINKVKSIHKKIDDFDADEVVNKIEKKKNEIKKKINRLKKFWNAKCTVKTRSYLIKYLKGLIKHIAPRRIRGYVRYGFDEPYKTGQVTGYLSLVPLVYQKGFSLEPDFYNKIIEADVKLKGRIRIGYIIRIALNVNLWRTVKLARKIMR